MSGDDPRVDLLAEAWVGRAVWASMDEGAREGMRPHYRDLLARLDAALAERSTEGGLERARDLVESHLHLVTAVRPEEPRFTITTDENGAEAAVTTVELADLMTSSKRPAEPEAARDLVAALYTELMRGLTLRTEELAERMAVVAQARIDAAVNAERRRILGGLHELRTEARTVTKRDAFRDAIAVVDEGAQR